MKQAAALMTQAAGTARRPATRAGCGRVPAAPRRSPACAGRGVRACAAMALWGFAAFCMPFAPLPNADGEVNGGFWFATDALAPVARPKRGAHACCKLNKAPPVRQPDGKP